MFKVLVVSISSFWAFNSYANINDRLRKKNVERLIKEFESEILVPTIKANELVSLSESELKENYIFVDVREDKEREVSTIVGSISKLDFESNQNLFKNKKIIVYCTIGYRSALYVEKMKRDGFNAWNLRGSILMWLHEGGVVVDAKGEPTNNVHVYGKKWDFAPEQNNTVFKKKSWFSKIFSR